MKISTDGLGVSDQEIRWLSEYTEDVAERIETITLRKERIRDINAFAVSIHYRNRSQKACEFFLLINEYGVVIEAESEYINSYREVRLLVQFISILNAMNIDWNDLPQTIDFQSYYKQWRTLREQAHRKEILSNATKQAMDLAESLQKQKAEQLINHMKEQPIVLQWERQGTYCRTRIGTDRLYVVKDNGRLARQFNEGQTIPLGTKKTLTLNVSRLDEQSRKMYLFMCMYVSADARSSFHLGPAALDAFCTLQEELDDEHLIGRIPTQTEKLPLELQASNDSVIMKECLEGQFCQGQNYLYRNDKDLIRLQWDENGQVYQLYQLLAQDGLEIERNAFKRFYQDVLLPNRDHLELHSDTDLQTFAATISNIKVFSDMEDSRILVWGTYEENGREKKFWAEPAGYPVSLITAIIEHYADQVEQQTAVFKTRSGRLFEFLDEGIPMIQKEADVYVSETLKNLKQARSLTVHVSAYMQNDLLKIQLDSDVDPAELSAILQAYRKKKTFYRLKNGEIIHLDSPALQELDELSDELNISRSELKKTTIKKPAYQSFHLQDRPDIRQDGSVQTYVQRLAKARQEAFELPEKYQKLLRDYQKDGVRWLKALYDRNVNGILADDMGLGKTLQVLCLLENFVSRQKPSLIVCPSSLMFNWASEIRKFEIDLDHVCVTGTQAERQARMEESHELYITTYDYLRRDAELYQAKTFNYVILDEAQYIKNPRTKNAAAVKSIDCSHRLALTGTPIENSLSELWSIFDFLMPGYLFSLRTFTRNYLKPIQQEHDEKQQERLRRLSAPFILRRTKKEVLTDLPDKVERDLWLDFSAEEKKLYLANLTQASKQLREELQMDHVDSVTILAMMTRLRQLCCEPRMVYDQIKTPSIKLTMCIDLVKTLKENQKKVLLFSGFTKVFDWLIPAFQKDGIRYHILTGKTTKEERKAEVEAFQNDDSDVFLISLKAGGTGLNLTKAQAVIHFDPWWNISAQNQATDRAYRIGQTKNVIVYQLLMKNSIEEKINEMQKRKKSLGDSLIDNASGTIAQMSAEELQALFTMEDTE